MPKKVIHLISTSVFSGAENVACQIINSFKNDKNYKMVYVSVIGKNKKRLEECNVQYYNLKKFNYKYIKKAIQELNPDIIHAHDIKASVMASLFSKRVKIISHIHANHQNMRKANLKTIIFNQRAKNLSSIIWVSKSALENYYFKSKVLAKSEILYNVNDTNALKDKANSDKKEYPKYDLIYLGRITYQKNPIRLINIIKDVKKIKQDLKVAIIGDGELTRKMLQEIKDLNLSANIDYYGFMSNPYKILESSKIMLMTSIYEGTPMCALEAMAFGIPIISTPTDGLKDIIKTGENGYLSNKDTELVKEIITLLSDESKLKAISNKTKIYSKKINNINDYKKKIEKIYK